MHGGHRLICSKVGDCAASGVAILIHDKYTQHIQKINCLHDRLMYVDLKFDKVCIRITAVYMPHAGYSYSGFADNFNDLTNLALDAANRRMPLLIGGDFNL